MQHMLIFVVWNDEKVNREIVCEVERRGEISEISGPNACLTKSIRTSDKESDKVIRSDADNGVLFQHF